ncbi:serine/arginine repetitive matrix protein 2-like isoform X2 [Amphibalanus amphitrite]|nr:serine/arginine repetitive matrix protein 2-like isoform X2 [Amphibalanus amphitrite]
MPVSEVAGVTPVSPIVSPVSHVSPIVSPMSPGSDSGLKSAEGGSRWHDAIHSGTSGNSTSGVGTSVGLGISSGTSVGHVTSGGAHGTSGVSVSAGGSTAPWADGDELLGLLDAIANRGRILKDENRQLAEVLSHTELSHHTDHDLDQDLDHEQEIHQDHIGDGDGNVTYRCRYCERPFNGHAATVDQTRSVARDPVTDALNMNIQMGGQTGITGGQSPLLGGQSPLLGGQSPLLGGQSPLLGGQSPLGGHNPLLGGHNPLLGGQYGATQSPLLGGQYGENGGHFGGLGGPYHHSPHVGQSPLLHGRTNPLRRSPAVNHLHHSPPGGAASSTLPPPTDPGCPLSLPVLRPREEYLSALTEVERLMQERDLLMDRLLGMELVAVRSQGQAASLQTRLQMVSAANEELRRELRLASSSRCEVDARIHDMHQQFVRSRRLQPSPAPAPAPARSTPDLRLPSRIPQPLSLRRRVDTTCEKSKVEEKEKTVERAKTMEERGRGTERAKTAEERVRGAEKDRVAECTRQTQTDSAAYLVNRETQTEVPPSPPAVLAVKTSGARVVPPDRARVAGILREMDPLKLQRQLIGMLVEAEVLRSQLAALGRDLGSGQSRVTATPRRQSATTAELSRQNEELRLQLAERQIELEGTRARLRQLETPSTPATPASRGRSSGAGRPSSLSASPHDRSIGHSSIPVLVRASSPGRRGRRLSASGVGDGPRSRTPSRATGDARNADVRADVRPGRGRGSGIQRRSVQDSSGSDLATVRAMRQLSSSLRRSTPNLSGSPPGAGQTDEQGSQTRLTAGANYSTGGRTSGLAAITGHLTSSSPNLAAASTSVAGRVNTRLQPQPPTAWAAHSPSPAWQQDPKVKADWRASFPNVASTNGDSSSTAPTSTTSSTTASSSKVPSGQSQAIGQILSTLSAPSSPGGGSETLSRTAADIRALRREMEARLQAARSGTEAGEVEHAVEHATEAVEGGGGDIDERDISEGSGDDCTSLESSPREIRGEESSSQRVAVTPPRRGGILERLHAIDSAAATLPLSSTSTTTSSSTVSASTTSFLLSPAPTASASGMAVDSRFGYHHTGNTRPDPALMPPNQGLIHQILTSHATTPSRPGSTLDKAEGGAVRAASSGMPGAVTKPKLRKSASLTPPSGERKGAAAHPKLVRSATLREGSNGGGGGAAGSPRAPPPKESGNARVGRYIRSLLQRISEVPDQ